MGTIGIRYIFIPLWTFNLNILLRFQVLCIRCARGLVPDLEKECHSPELFYNLYLFQTSHCFKSKQFMHFWHTCRGQNLRTLSGKFLRVKVCRLESWDFLGLWARQYLCMSNLYHQSFLWSIIFLHYNQRLSLLLNLFHFQITRFLFKHN